MTHSPLPWQTHTQIPTSLFDANGEKVAQGLTEENVALILGMSQEIERLRAQIERVKVHFAQALRQWTFYAEMVEQPTDPAWRLEKETTPEAALYRAAENCMAEICSVKLSSTGSNDG